MQRTATLPLSLLLALGCSGSFDPAGTYQGNATLDTDTTRASIAPDGEAATRSRSTRNPARVVVTRVDDFIFELALGDFCRVRMMPSPEPNEHELQVPMGARCPVHLDGFAGDAGVSGSATFGRDPRTLSVTLLGGGRSTDPSSPTVVFTYQFEGTVAER